MTDYLPDELKAEIASVVTQHFMENRDSFRKAIVDDLFHLVDRFGERLPPQYTDGTPWVCHMVSGAVQELARVAILESLRDIRPAISSAVKSALSADRVGRAVHGALYDAIADGLSIELRFSGEDFGGSDWRPDDEDEGGPLEDGDDSSTPASEVGL